MPRGGVSDAIAAAVAAAIDAAERAGLLPEGGLYGQVKMPDPARGACCTGSAVKGPQYCTCWTEEYDAAQQDPRPGEPGRRDAMCGACAYRKGSPERRGDDRYQGSEDGFLDRIVATGERFWCHAGTRQAVRLVHPSGAVVDLLAAAPGDYRPPVVAGVPYKADGTPADLCAGWAARRRKYLERAGRAS